MNPFSKITTTIKVCVFIVMFLFLCIQAIHAQSLESTNYKFIDATMLSGGGIGIGDGYNMLLTAAANNSDTRLFSSSYRYGSGFPNGIQANVPIINCFETSTTASTTTCNYLPSGDGMIAECGILGCYNRAKIEIDDQNNPADTLYLVAISPNFWSSIYYLQSDHSIAMNFDYNDYMTQCELEGIDVDNVSCDDSSDPDWNLLLQSFNIFSLLPDTTYQIAVRAVHGDFTETRFSQISIATTTNNIITTPTPTPTPTITPTIHGPTPTLQDRPCKEDINQTKCQVDVEIIQYTTTPTETTSKICWTTNIETIGFVEYGLIDSDTNNAILSNSSEVSQEYLTSHCVTIESLEPASSYAIKIYATSLAEKSAEKNGEFATLGGKVPTDVVVKECITYNSNFYTFSNNNQVIIKYTTSGNASCILYFGHKINSLNGIAKTTSNNTYHESTIDLSKVDGKTDIIYRIDCVVQDIEENEKQCTIRGNVPISKYLDFYPLNIRSVISKNITKISTTIAPITLTTVAVGTSLFNIFLFPRFLLYALGWLRRDKKVKPWGIVYDEQNKIPIPFVSVKLFDNNNQFILEKITNTEGQYGFAVTKGNYILTASHPDYLDFTAEIEIIENETIISRDIPLNQNESSYTRLKSTLRDNLRIINTFIVYIGFTFSIIAMIFSPILVNYIIVCFYLLQFLIIYLSKSKNKWGYVFNSMNNKRIVGAFVRVFDTKKGKQVDVQMTDKFGRYGFILDEGEYQISVNHELYKFPSHLQNVKNIVRSKVGKEFVKIKVEKNKTIDLPIPLDQIIN